MRHVPLLELMKDNNGYDRMFKRYRVNFRVRVQTVAGENPDGTPTPKGPEVSFLGFAHNISLSGIGFVCSGQLGLGSLVEIEVTLEERTYLLLARVRWQQQTGTLSKTMHHYGVQFLRTEAVLEFIPAAAEFLLAQGSPCLAKRGPRKTTGVSAAGEA